MKTIQLNELKQEALLTQKEPIAIEYNNKIIGYYNPVIDYQKAKKIKEDGRVGKSEIYLDYP